MIVAAGPAFVIVKNHLVNRNVVVTMVCILYTFIYCSCVCVIMQCVCVSMRIYACACVCFSIILHGCIIAIRISEKNETAEG